VTIQTMKQKQAIEVNSSNEKGRSLGDKSRKLAGKIIVVKYGGAALEHTDLRMPILRDVALLKEAGATVVLIHGGSRRLSQVMATKRLEVRMIRGLRYTSSETVEVARTVFGELNKEIVELLDATGASPVGLKGEDNGLIMAKLKDFNLYGYVGDVQQVDVAILVKLIKKHQLPVISGLGVDGNGRVLNINLDLVAAAVAGELHADTFVLITDVDGILRDVKDPDTLMPLLDMEQLDSLQDNRMIGNGMLPKIEACLCAMRQDVKNTYVMSCRQPHALITELIGETHYGTHIVR